MFEPLPINAICCCALLGAALALAGSGCVSKSKAKLQAREAFVAGQQQAIARLQQVQTQGPHVTLIGRVQNASIPWTADLTVAKAIVEAGYFGRADPRTIIVVRQGQAYTINPKELLRGQDMPLESGDLVQINE